MIGSLRWKVAFIREEEENIRVGDCKQFGFDWYDSLCHKQASQV